MPPEEIVPRGRRHSIRRDKQAVSHHYDVGNEFYELVLGPAMTYSCARFAEPALIARVGPGGQARADLPQARSARHEHAPARRIRPRLLDVGCGWGSMAIHAATQHDVDVVGHHDQRGTGGVRPPTGRATPASTARSRSASRTIERSTTVRSTRSARSACPSTSAPSGSTPTSTSSTACCVPAVACSTTPSPRSAGRGLRRRSFIYRYVFPDGELLDIADSTRSMERAGFEIRDVENLREHYAQTLRYWVSNLQAHWDDATTLVGEPRARVWLLYMSGSINGFDDARIQIHQALGVRNTPDGTSDMPRNRRSWD